MRKYSSSSACIVYFNGSSSSLKSDVRPIPKPHNSSSAFTPLLSISAVVPMDSEKGKSVVSNVISPNPYVNICSISKGDDVRRTLYRLPPAYLSAYSSPSQKCIDAYSGRLRSEEHTSELQSR